MKRILCALLTLVLLVGLVPQKTYAAEGENRHGSIIVNFAGAVHKRQVLIDEDGGYYVPLSWLSYYGANIARIDSDSHWEFYSTRQDQTGNFAKRVFIGKDKPTFEVGLYTSDSLWKKMKDGAVSTPKRIHGKYYRLYSGTFSQTYTLDGELWAPLAEVLPLINVEVSVSADGQLCLLPVLMTTFEALHLHGNEIEDLLFDADEVVGNEFMTVGGWIVSTTMDLRIDRLDVIWNTGRRNDYEQLFKEYLVDNQAYLSMSNAESSPIMEHIAQVKESSGTIKSVYQVWGQTYDALEMFKNIDSKPTGTKLFKGVLDTTTKGVNAVVSLYEYAYTYCNQVEDHRHMLGAVYTYQKKPKEDSWPSYKAAMDVQKLYDTESVDVEAAFWETARDQANDWIKGKITENLPGALKPWFIAIELTKVFAAEDYQFVANSALMGLIDNVVEYSWDIYKKRLHDCKYNAADLDDLRLSAMLSLVASRHAFHTYWKGNLKGLEADMDECLIAFYTAGSYRDYDAADTHKNLKKRYQKLMDKLLCYEPMEGDLARVEYGIVMAALQEMAMDDLKWTLNDADGDGNGELLIHALPYNAFRESQIVVDADSFVLDTHTAVGASQISEFVLLEGRDGWALSHGGASAMNGGDFFYRWTGDTWMLHTGIEWNVEETSDGNFTRTEKIYAEGAVISEGSFNHFSEDGLGFEYPGWKAPTWDSPDVTDFVAAGDASALLKQLDAYMDTRYGGLDGTRSDFNGDGKEDGLYAIDGATKLWFGNVSGLTEGDEPWAQFKDDKLTLVAAETVAGGLRIRIQRLDISTAGMDSPKDWSLENGHLTLGNLELDYSAEGDAFRQTAGQVTGLSAAELAQFQTLFQQDLWYRQALTSDYPTPAQVDVSQLFYNGYDGAEANVQEVQYLRQLWGEDDNRLYMDLPRVTGGQMDEVLRTYFGVDRTGIDGEGITAFTYIEATDAYILSHGDANTVMPSFDSGVRFGPDQVVLRYENWQGQYEVTLRQQGGRWLLVSNMPVLGGMG